MSAPKEGARNDKMRISWQTGRRLDLITLTQTWAKCGNVQQFACALCESSKRYLINSRIMPSQISTSLQLYFFFLVLPWWLQLARKGHAGSIEQHMHGVTDEQYRLWSSVKGHFSCEIMNAIAMIRNDEGGTDLQRPGYDKRCCYHLGIEIQNFKSQTNQGICVNSILHQNLQVTYTFVKLHIKIYRWHIR